MGAWNTSILGNDTSAEVYEYFKRMYNYQEGGDYKWSAQQIADSFVTYYYQTIKDLPSEKCAIYFAMALAFWERGELRPGIKKIVHDLIYNKIDYEAWKDLGANEKTLKSRWAATIAFYEKIKTPNPTPKKRELKDSKVSAYHIGECFAYKFGDHYYGLIVGNDGRNADDGSNNFSFVDIKKKTVPNLQDFEESYFMSDEDLCNHFLGIDAGHTGIPPVVFSYRFGRGASKKMEKTFIHIGKLPYFYTFFQSTMVRFSPITTKHKSPEEMMKQALEFWSKKQGKVSEYKVGYECTKKLDLKQLKSAVLVAGDMKIPFEDILVKIDNSLWHVIVTFFVKNKDRKEVERSWIWFAQLFESLTGRELNSLELAHTENDMVPLNKIDFKRYKLKNAEDTAII